VHDGDLGNAPLGRLQVYVFFCISSASSIGLRLLPEREQISRHDNQSDSDMRLGWFQHKGIAALMPKPSCRPWSGISLPNSFPLTESSTHVPSGNGGEENCISVSATAHLESSPQSNGTVDAGALDNRTKDNGTVNSATMGKSGT
jgi:hypothetical protein